jgi:DNA-binding NarL/FixJ family response regulator
VETEESIVAWAEAGVAGYIPRTAALADLITLLTDILLGEQVCSGTVAAGLLRRIASAAVPGRGQGVQPVVPLLTFREQQIVQLITEGMTNKGIARHLDIGVATTKSHVHSLLRKLSLNRRGQVALWARDHEGMARVRLLQGIMRHNRAEITKRSSDS